MSVSACDADVAGGLARVARRCFGGDAHVESAVRLSGGAMNELWAFDVAAAGMTRSLILRRGPGGVARAGTAGMETEARLIRLAGEARAPVPAVVHVLDEDDDLGSGFVMARVEGESLAPRILRDPAYAQARPLLARQLGEAAARIHAVEGADDLPLVSAAEALEKADETYRRVCGPRPVMEWTLRWLADHLPPPDGPVAVVHGDLRNGNIMVGPEGLRAVLDWEGVHRGDPMEDLGWLCVTSWRFGEVDKPVGGFGSREALFEGYEAAGGAPVDADRVRFWEVMGVLRWGLICASMADAFSKGDRSVEMAAIGRRVSETELDLLAMLAPRGGYRHA